LKHRQREIRLLNLTTKLGVVPCARERIVNAKAQCTHARMHVALNAMDVDLLARAAHLHCQRYTALVKTPLIHRQ
jgi:hypothetical protein